MKNLLLLIVILTGITTSAQKKALTHNDYDLWKRVSNTVISDNGKVTALSVVTSTGAGDGYLTIVNNQTGETFPFFNGVQPIISSDEKYVYFIQKPAYQVTRQEKKDEVKKDKRSSNTFMVFDVNEGKIIDSITRVNRYRTNEQGSFAIIEHLKDQKPVKKESKKERKKRLKAEKKAKKKGLAIKPLYQKEKYLIVYQPKDLQKDTLTNYKDYTISEKGTQVLYSVKGKKDKSDKGLYLFNLEKRKSTEIHTGAWRYENLALDPSGIMAAYHIAMDSAATDSLKFGLHLTSLDNIQPKDIAGQGNKINTDWELTKGMKPRFSKNGKRLFFYSQPKLKYTIDTTLLKDEIAQVDVWNYLDGMTQPEQKLRVNRLKNQSTTHIYDVITGSYKKLNDYNADGVMWDKDQEGNLALIASNDPYDVSRSWEYPWRSDYHILDLKSGKKSLLIKGTGSRPIMNDQATLAVNYNYDDQQWYAYDLITGTSVSLTGALNVAFHDENDDHPALPPAHGFGGFYKNQVLLFDEYDVWMINPNNPSEFENLTQTGRNAKITYRTMRLDREHRNTPSSIDGSLLLSSFNHTTKDSGIHLLDKDGVITDYVVEQGYEVTAFAKAKNSNELLFRKGNFQNYPDTYLKRGETEMRLSNANPQQSEFKWGTVELYKWTAYDGTELEGLLYKPEDFDPNRKYPLMVYFYETYSERLHGYRSPQPSASTVNFSYLVSNDYIVFVPDIVYKDGHPGQSAYNCIVSGTEALAKESYIDNNAMALQGQSWGGYQTAYLVTQTNMYAAAMAGAPVSNMTSAYGGIRWGSGLSRAFQYERTQSRLGKNLWDGFDLYIENSPLFHIPKIETPLLMMHNDDDGAVPYYQGIEMFMGMRRLNKPVWLLVYNNEAHNLRKMKNKRDLSVRMMQFFDHYLKGAPAPVWLTKGLPAHKKGKQLGYEFEN